MCMLPCVHLVVRILRGLPMRVQMGLGAVRRFSLLFLVTTIVAAVCIGRSFGQFVSWSSYKPAL
jgi:hypothetical protein